MECAKERFGEDITQSTKGGICPHLKRRARCNLCGGRDLCGHGKIKKTCFKCKLIEKQNTSRQEIPITTILKNDAEILQGLVTMTSSNSFACRINLPAELVCGSMQTQEVIEINAASSTLSNFVWLSTQTLSPFVHEKEAKKKASKVCKSANAQTIAEKAQPTPVKKVLVKRNAVMNFLPQKQSGSTQKTNDQCCEDGTEVIIGNTAGSQPHRVEENLQLQGSEVFSHEGYTWISAVVAAITEANKQPERPKPQVPCKSKTNNPPIHKDCKVGADIKKKVVKRQKRPLAVLPRPANGTSTEAIGLTMCKVDEAGDHRPVDPACLKIDELDYILELDSAGLESDWINATDSNVMMFDLCDQTCETDDAAIDPSAFGLSTPLCMPASLDLHFVDHWKEWIFEKSACLDSQKVMREFSVMT
jgi:hypothetical protein